MDTLKKEMKEDAERFLASLPSEDPFFDPHFFDGKFLIKGNISTINKLLD